MPGQNAGMGVQRFRSSGPDALKGRAKVLWVDGRAYLRVRDRPADSIAWVTGKRPSAVGLRTEDGWPFIAPLEAMTDTSAQVRKSTTTVLGEMPNQVALQALGMMTN